MTSQFRVWLLLFSLQEVYVAEPNVEDTITILRGLRERYEVHHGVQIQDSALVAAAQLSAKYMTVRQRLCRSRYHAPEFILDTCC